MLPYILYERLSLPPSQLLFSKYRLRVFPTIALRFQSQYLFLQTNNVHRCRKQNQFLQHRLLPHQGYTVSRLAACDQFLEKELQNHFEKYWLKTDLAEHFYNMLQKIPVYLFDGSDKPRYEYPYTRRTHFSLFQYIVATKLDHSF